MVFNWFRRQHNESQEQAQDKSASPTQVEPQTESPVSESGEVSSQEQVADDYLAWAKAAYKNIQAKQRPQTTTTPSETESPTQAEAEPQLVTEAVAPSSESQAIPIQTETPQTESDAEVAVEAAEQALEELETAVAAESAIPEIVAAEVEKVTSIAENVPDLSVTAETAENREGVAQEAVPFWARDDRQARLQRLMETAIQEPEPEVRPVSATTEPAAIAEFADVVFDDGFLWSAEVLAAQGRRPEDVSIEEITWLKKLRQGLDKTRRNLINQLKAIVGQGPLNQDAVMEIEALLLQADVGVEATDYIIKALQSKLREQALPPEQAISYLKKILRDMLEQPFVESYKRTFAPEKDTFNIWVMTGVNGAGKTTTIGKIAHLAVKSGYKCLIAAADTFRAAAVEQVKIWGQRSGVEAIANPGENTDPAAVVFDAIAAAKARGSELLIVDTAGRLQNKKNLMDELSKIRRIIDKKAPDAKVEALLVLDATLGQNGLRQAQVFSEAVKLSGVVLTKLDGTAKGGIALAVVQQLGLPIRFIGAGEGIEDLRPFSSYEFVEALLSG
ncbi:signal recognition particle-docking protein FtsY [Planktothrix sp. FACHB-1355]|uniref:Signal recognition particle receptor FtsY n=1 Tax=Aerosakkonema funiforme FACHB-1375 TaxID=2949571 RepID=A0A926VEM2_9CYAN|nr:MULTISPECIES: signal recognition particle-docking protein FtsY [Oscillatoriales]MBD2182220.1 signal recognition particle-docking protein FtsY [Aerosakkonema funiforme FACHB-1375]MBD3558886.1 signal recognition particle-docking protein FtsY [Planktothrix sp. FACHB-1355]